MRIDVDHPTYARKSRLPVRPHGCIERVVKVCAHRREKQRLAAKAPRSSRERRCNQSEDFDVRCADFLQRRQA